MKTKRDQQRSKVYAFDHVIYDLFSSRTGIVHKKGGKGTSFLGVVLDQVEQMKAEGGVVLPDAMPYVRPAGKVDKRIDLTLDEIKKIAQWAAKKYHVAYYELTVKDGRRCHSASGGRYEMVMPRWLRYPGVTVHEIAHVVAERLIFGSKHDEFYVRVYCDLAVRLMSGPQWIKDILCPKGKVEVEDLVKLAREAGVKVAPATKLKAEIAKRKELK